ncbi:MAG: hypothetical protein BWZ10_00279 [candidate division BRC1 bacterium ADurb.BinA364]|nr:MAG: hypothetical protein BWZ10_00279 [candidate division BRC1 bacterium ADurb.BinA364]
MYFEVPVLASDWFDTPILARLIRQSPDTDALLDDLLRQNVRHVFFNFDELTQGGDPFAREAARRALSGDTDSPRRRQALEALAAHGPRAFALEGYFLRAFAEIGAEGAAGNLQRALEEKGLEALRDREWLGRLLIDTPEPARSALWRLAAAGPEEIDSLAPRLGEGHAAYDYYRRRFGQQEWEAWIRFVLSPRLEIVYGVSPLQWISRILPDRPGDSSR